MKLLLEHRANPDLADEDRRTPLMQAALDGEIEIAKMLLVAGADPSLRDEDRDSALMLAADKRNIQIVRLLLTHKADPKRLTAISAHRSTTRWSNGIRRSSSSCWRPVPIRT